MSRRIDVCGIQMNTGLPDINGARWAATKLGDWTSPSHKQELGDATGRPGATMLSDRHGEHVFTVEGFASGPTLEVVDAAANQLNRMPGVGNEGDVVYYETVPKVLRVRQGGTPKAEPPDVRNDGWRIDFQLTLVALDPYKRGLELHKQALTPGATASVTNAGNVAAVLSLRTTNAGTVIVRQNDSRQVFRTRMSIASGTDFDGGTRTVTTGGGVVIFPMGAPSEWLSVPAESTVSLTNLGTAPVSASWYDPYA